MYLCSFCTVYFLTHQEGIDQEAIDGRLDFHPFMVETLQCFALFQTNAISAKPLKENILVFKALIERMNKNLTASYYTLAEKAKNEDDMSRCALRTEMMVHTLAVRNWAYEPQMLKVTYDLANRIKERFTEIKGFDPVVLLDILFGLSDLTSNRVMEHIEKLRPMIRAKNYEEVFDTYEKAFPHVIKTQSSQREGMFNHFGKNLKSLKDGLMQHADLILKDIFTFSKKDLQVLGNNMITKMR